MSAYMKNRDGVHYVPVEHGLCGDAWDISSEDEGGGDMVEVPKQRITCERCREHIADILAEFGKGKFK